MAAPTTAQIQAAINTARQLNLSWADIAEVVKTGIFYAQMNSSLEVEFAWSTVNSDGTSISRMSMLDAVKFYQLIKNLDSGGIASNLAEFNA